MVLVLRPDHDLALVVPDYISAVDPWTDRVRVRVKAVLVGRPGRAVLGPQLRRCRMLDVWVWVRAWPDA